MQIREIDHNLTCNIHKTMINMDILNYYKMITSTESPLCAKNYAKVPYLFFLKCQNIYEIDTTAII